MNLKKEVSRCLDQLSPRINEFPWENAAAYAHWVGQTYYYVCHSSRLLALAAARFEEPKLRSRFMDHLREERGHENLALHDLKGLGVRIEEIPCFAETHAFYMSQYYFLEHSQPAAFFGWILCLEGTAVRDGGTLYARVKNAHGDKAAAFLRVHAEEDISHLDQAYAAMEGVNPAALPALLENLKVSAELYSAFLNRCAAAGKSTSRAA